VHQETASTVPAVHGAGVPGRDIGRELEIGTTAYHDVRVAARTGRQQRRNAWQLRRTQVHIEAVDDQQQMPASDAGPFRDSPPQCQELIFVRVWRLHIEQVRQFGDHRGKEPGAVCISLPAGEKIRDYLGLSLQDDYGLGKQRCFPGISLSSKPQVPGDVRNERGDIFQLALPADQILSALVNLPHSRPVSGSGRPVPSAETAGVLFLARSQRTRSGTPAATKFASTIRATTTHAINQPF